MVAAISKNFTYHQNPKRPPLLPSEAENNGVGEASRRRPKSKEVSSRYLSTSSSSSSSSISTTSSNNTTSTYTSSSSYNSSIRSQSPVFSGTPAPVHSSGRSKPVDRRRPVTPEKTPSHLSRSLSVSFQGESFPMPVAKTVRKFATPERMRTPAPDRRKISPATELFTPAKTPARDRTDSVRPSDQHRWPGRLKSLNSSFLTRSLDCGTIDKLKNGSVSVTPLNSVIKEYHKAKSKLKNDNNVDALTSDSESVSSGSTNTTTGVHDARTVTPRGIVVPARFWQETNNRIQRGHEEKNGKLKCSNNNNNGPALSPRRGVTTPRGGLVSPVRGGVRPASPSKGLTMTPFRGMPSPTRTRNGVVSNNLSCNTPSILSFAVDAARRGKVGENQIVDAHELRLLYNRHLQWRFVNARAEAALRAQTATAERNLYNAWLTTLKLRHSVKTKRIQLQQLRQNVKLYSILKGQDLSLENWSLMDEEYCNSLSEAICAMEACTIRLPVVAGARSEVQNVKNAISSAVDVMQAMGSSLRYFLPKVEQVDSTINELANVVANERALLVQCKDLLSSLTAVQVKDCSLRTHLLQVKRVVSCSSTEV